EKAHAENSGDTAAQWRRCMFLHEGIGKAEIHRKGDCDETHCQCGEKKTMRPRHAKNASGNRDDIEGHEFQSAFAFDRKQTDSAKKCSGPAYCHQPAEFARSQVENVAHVEW